MRRGIEEFARTTLRSNAWIDFAAAAGALVAGALIITIAYQAAFWVVWILLPVVDPQAAWLSRIGGAVFVGLVFVSELRNRRKLFEVYSAEPTVGGAVLSAAFYAVGVGWGPRQLIPLSPGTARNSVKLLADILYSGPRLLSNAVRIFRRARAGFAANHEACGRVLVMAVDSRKRLSFEDIEDAVPDLDLMKTLEELSWLGGVVFLKSEPPGLTLTDTLREKLEGLVSARG